MFTCNGKPPRQHRAPAALPILQGSEGVAERNGGVGSAAGAATHPNPAREEGETPAILSRGETAYPSGGGGIT